MTEFAAGRSVGSRRDHCRMSGAEWEDRTAYELAAALAEDARLQSVCVIGSTARGDCDSSSDIDLLAVAADGSVRLTELKKSLPKPRIERRVQLKLFNERGLRELFDRRTTFAVHILREAVPVVDRDASFERMRRRYSLDAPAQDDGSWFRVRLELYEDLDWCHGFYLFCLADCYALGRAAAILALAREGEFEFRKSRAFVRFRQRYPELSEATEVIQELEPFYLLARRNVKMNLPFPHRDCHEEAQAARDACADLVDVLP